MRFILFVTFVSSFWTGTSFAAGDRNDNVIAWPARALRSAPIERPPFDAWSVRYAAATAALDRVYAEFARPGRPAFARAFALDVTADHDTAAEVDAFLASYGLALAFAAAPVEDGGDGGGLDLDLASAHRYAVATVERRVDRPGVELEIAAIGAARAKLAADGSEGGFGLDPAAARARAVAVVTAMDLAVPSEVLDRLERERILTDAFARPLGEGGLEVPPAERSGTLAAWLAKPAPVRDVMHLLDRYEIAIRAYVHRAGASEPAVAREWALEVARRTRSSGETHAWLATLGYFAPPRDRHPTPVRPSALRRAAIACWRVLTGR